MMPRRPPAVRPGYDGHCRDLTADERAAFASEGRTHVVRFRTPDDGASTFTDAIRGEVSVEWRLIRDFVIQRADGTPIFFLANAVDDIDMGITHVIRGEDLLDSTHRVLALRAALGGGVPPVYAHLPLIVDAATRAKLSKRHGVIALEDFRQDGLPARSADELPRAPGMGAVRCREWRRDHVGGRARRRIRPRPRHACGRGLRSQEARLDER